MSGKLYPIHDVRIAKAYCSGRLAAKNGDLVGTNPHTAGSPEATNWAAGHGTWADNPTNGPEQGRDCCGGGLLYGGGYVPMAVMSELVLDHF